MAIGLDKLLELIPFDSEKRTRRTKDDTNLLVRERLRQLTGFRFATRGRGRRDVEGLDDVSVRIELVPGLPTALRNVTIDDDDWILAVLALHRPDLEALQASAGEIAEIIPMLSSHQRGLELLKGREAHLQPVAALAEDLLRAVASFDLLGKILEVNEDVLGAYFPPRSRGYGGQTDPRIELYWAVIGLVAPLIKVTPEALCVVVLAHELAHAFTHMGADIDGHRWDTDAFVKSKTELKEGLAQYYTEATCKKLGVLAPTATDAYERLLEKQPDAYKVHVPWLSNYRPEEVRLALVETRRTEESEISKFDAVLNTARKRLRRTPSDAEPD